MSSPIPLLNCIIYGYATAMPRGFFNQDRFIKMRAASPTTRERWESYFNQLKNASLLLDQKFGDTIKSLM